MLTILLAALIALLALPFILVTTTVVAFAYIVAQVEPKDRYLH